MSKINNEKTFFGLGSSDKAKIVRQAASLANKDQIAMVERHGGLSAVKDYCKCN